MICPDCGSTHFVFEDYSSICSLCYVHGRAKAKLIAARRRRELAKAQRNDETSALRKAFG